MATLRQSEPKTISLNDSDVGRQKLVPSGGGDDLHTSLKVKGISLGVDHNPMNYHMLLGYTSVYQLCWGKPGTAVLTHGQMKVFKRCYKESEFLHRLDAVILFD